MNSIPVQHIRASQTFFDVAEPDVAQTRPPLFREILQKPMENEEALKRSTENQEFLPAFDQSPVQHQKRRRIEYESGNIGSMTNESPPSNKNVTSSLTREVQADNRQNPLTIHGLLEPTSQPILPGAKPPDQVRMHGNRDETKSMGMVATNRAPIARGRPSLPLRAPSSENREFKHMYTNAPVGVISKLPQQIRTAIENSALWKWERDQDLQVTGCLATLFPKSNQQDVSFTIWCGNEDGYDIIEAFGLQLDISS
ncbi:Hypothetical protein PENO1_111770 [Penicillium occitanis (nom. inval.)]|nr:Hypothetical protein PENO1_111770 [Penicillium occitanis (nom. inval.)]PCG88208.1 hypothetical protein PENOC_112050 [Penicillium occitanis (nom. inval.)]